MKTWHRRVSELSPPHSCPIPGPLSKVRGLAEILRKNYIIITLAALRTEALLGFCILCSHNRWPLCLSERDPYHTAIVRLHTKAVARDTSLLECSQIWFFCGLLLATIFHLCKKKQPSYKWVSPRLLDLLECTLKTSRLFTQTFIYQRPV